MEQELTSKVGIIGGGPAGCFCAYLLQNSKNVTIFDFGSPLRTILPTGGGRCNLAHAELDFRELAKNYPRGEKFLYSVFSKFSTADTIDFFEKIGIQTYIQDDMRIFPNSNSAKDVREKFLSALNKVTFKKERVLRINTKPLTIVTDMGSYAFDKVVISTGGHAGYDCAKFLGHNIISPKPALTALKTVENFKQLAGVSIKNVKSEGMIGDIIFTHEGVSGPLIYKISSIKARDNFPYKIVLDLCDEFDLQDLLNNNPHKSIKNLLSEFVPRSFAEFILKNPDEKCHKINGKTRDEILKKLHNFEITVKSASKDGEVVTCGGVDLKEINPKTMESKLVEGVYFCGEVIDIDGFCGGFNLQNCWSTAYVAAQGIMSNLF